MILKIFCVLVVIFLCGSNGSRRTFEGSQVWKALINNDDDRAELYKLQKKLNLRFMKERQTEIDFLVDSSNIDDLDSSLNQLKIEHYAVVENVQQLIAKENPNTPKKFKGLKSSPHNVTFTRYNSIAEIYQFLQYLAAKYSKTCSLINIGKSIEGRDMLVMKISNGNPGNKAVWIDGGIHAREWVSPASVSYVINELVVNNDKQSESTKNTDFYICNVVNPDGYEYSRTTDRFWRKNRRNIGDGSDCYGVDLNRNYDILWNQQGTSNDSCDETYAGTGPFTEPETRAIRNFFESRNYKFDSSVSVHSYGQNILVPWGYSNESCSDSKDLNKVALAANKKFTANYNVGNSGASLYFASGCSDDWAKSKGVKYVYTIELRQNDTYGFTLPSRFILPTGKDLMGLVTTIANTISTSKKSVVNKMKAGKTKKNKKN